MNSCQRSIVNYKKKIGGYTALGSGVYTPINVGVTSIYALDEEHVYIGGTFTTANDITANQITMWNGKTNTFNALGGALQKTDNGTCTIYAIYALDAEHVYIGGNFVTIGGITYNRIAMWNGNDFTALGTSPNVGVGTINNDRVSVIHALDAEHIYIGGTFNNTFGYYITMYNQTNNTFTKLGTTILNSNVSAIYALDAEHIYIGGSFSNVNNSSIHYIVMYNQKTQTYTTLFADAYKSLSNTSYVTAIDALDAEHIYIGGFFSSIEGTKYNGIVMYNQNTKTFSALGTQPDVGVIDTFSNAYPYAIYALDTEHIYIGGKFIKAGGIAINNITVWNQTTQSFTALGGGVGVNGNIVRAIYALNAEHLYIGGIFTSATNPTGNITVNNITRWAG